MMEEYITAAEAARRLGLNTEYASQLARRSKKKGNPWPVKRGRYWYAPLSEWQKILTPEDKKQRKKRKKISLKKSGEGSDLITCAEAARVFGFSRSWATELAKRSRESGREWPKKMGRLWMASLEDWKAVFESEQLKSWSRVRKK